MQYGCIGEHLPHSFSKEIHAQIGSYPYELKELAPVELSAFMEAHDFCGINVTIPYKQAVIPFLDMLDPLARAVGAVNTIVNRDGLLFGFNTDVAGMEALLRKTGIELSGRKVLILGTGGTAKTAAAVAKRAEAASFHFVSRSGKNGAITYASASALHTDAQIIINTTPCGMYPHPFEQPISLSPFYRLEGVIDAVYNPLETQLVATAREKGIPASCGLYMLVSQAVAAYGYFMNITPDASLSDSIYAALLRNKSNIVLIGMPGSGKTTIGRRIAADTGREFLDTDALIVAETGREIRSIFESDGEPFFRDLESRIVREVSLRSGCVIATGGGAILRKENLDALRLNGKLYFLDRSPALLVPTEDRPLADCTAAIHARYNERYPKYLAAADEIIPADGTVAEITTEIERRLGYETANIKRTESESPRNPGT